MKENYLTGILTLIRLLRALLMALLQQQHSQGLPEEPRKQFSGRHIGHIQQQIEHSHTQLQYLFMSSF
jgi:hypothetical protein